MGIPHPSELFSLHLNGRAKDFVEILMDLWPRYVCTRMCLMCVSLTTVSWRNTFTIDRGRGAEKKCVVLARISVTASCLHEPVFAPKGNNEVGGKKKPCWWTCVWLHFQNSAPCIIICPSFMHLWKNHLWGFGSAAKASLSEEGSGWKVRQTETKKWRIHQWQSQHSLVYTLTG